MTADDSLDQPFSVLAVLAVRYPAWTIWYGEATRHWWALPPHDQQRDHLVEAPTVKELVEAIEAIKVRPRTPFPVPGAPRPASAVRGRWLPTARWQSGTAG